MRPDARTEPDASGDPLFDEAVGLLIRLQENPADAATRATLTRWRERSPRHEQVWAELQSIHAMTGRALAPARVVHRRRLLQAACWGGAAALGSWMLLPGAILAARADYRTGVAETRDVALPDLGRITLAPETAVAVDVGAGRPLLQLLVGTIWCDIPALTVPFTLLARETRLTTRAASFEVTEASDSIQIAVARGQVTVTSAGRDEALAGAEWLRLFGDGSVRHGQSAKDNEPAAWRNNRLQADSEPVASLVERIAPWLSGRVVLASPALGRQRVSGVFDLSHPISALRAVVWPHGGRVRQIGPLLTVVTTV